VRALIGASLLGTALAFPASAVAQLLSPNPTVVSTGPNGEPVTGLSALVRNAMTPDGRFVVVLGRSGELVGSDAPGAGLPTGQLVLIDRVTNDRRVVSVNAQGVGQVNPVIPSPAIDGNTLSISDDGNRIVFNSTANNLDPAAPSGAQRCYLWDRAVGHAVALDVDPLPGLQARLCGDLTANGREVVAHCSQPDANTMGMGVCVRDIDAGTIQRLAPGRGASFGVPSELGLRISADGSTVAFSGWRGNNVVGLVRLDRASGVVTEVVPGPAAPVNVSLSGSGRYLAYNEQVYDHVTNFRRVIARAPLDAPTRATWDLSISRDGRLAAFRTSAPEFERPFTGLPFGTGRIQVYRLDLATDRLDLVSRVGLDGPIADRSHDPCENPGVLGCYFNRFSPRISGDGRFVSFAFPRANLAPSYPAGSESAPQLFIKDMGPAAPLVNAVPVPLDRRWLFLGLGLSLLLIGGIALVRRV
jgi:Tol biopolymer transport system component